MSPDQAHALTEATPVAPPPPKRSLVVGGPVPNKFPTRTTTRRIAIIGEAPGEKEVNYHICPTCHRGGDGPFRCRCQLYLQHPTLTPERDMPFGREDGIDLSSAGIPSTPSPRPFVGPSGQLLNQFLAHAGIDREACFVGNVTPWRPAGNKVELFKWAGPEIQEGLAQLAADLATYQPHLVILLGNTALRAFSGEKRTVGDWRGYVWRATQVCPGVKCIGMWHPAAILREMGLTGEEKFYMARAAREAAMDGLVMPERRVEVAAPWHGLTAQDVVNGLGVLRAKRQSLSLDIEGSCSMGPACIGFAYTPNDAFVVPIYGVDGESIWSEEDEILIVGAVIELLEDPLVPKTIQNSLYEYFVIAWTWGCVVQGLQDDTMVKHFELLAEMDKALEFQAVLYTNQPYWKLTHREVEGRYVPFKDGRRATNEEWYVYNGTDCMVTYEVNQVMEGKLKPQQREHYRYQMSLLVPLAYMSLRGIAYSKGKAKERLEETWQRIYEYQDQINQEAARGRPGLQEFYRALGCGGGRNNVRPHLVEGTTNQEGLAETAKEAREGEVCLPALIPLLTTAFCQARRTEAREVTETTWQPKAWNGKRWVKVGKRVKDLQDFKAGHYCTCDSEPDKNFYPEGVYWLTPVRKLITRNLPVEITSLRDVQRFARASQLDVCKRACTLSQKVESGPLSPAQRGELSTLLGLHCNTESTNKGGDAQWFLYEHCQFEKQFAKEGNRKTDRLTTDTEALLRIWTKTQDPRCKLVLALRAALTAVETLAAGCDPDGRIRTGYNLVGTNTGRLSCYESPTGSGFNLQTVTKRDRDLFSADPGMELYSCDLAGADSWTVAAHAARCGDRTMLDDLLGKLKPAKIVALMQMHGVSVNSQSRDTLRVMCEEVPDDGGLYPASKATTHGSNYGMKELTMANNILKQSYKKTGVPIVVQPAQCKRLQGFYFIRYNGVPRWQDSVARQLREVGSLTTPFGFTRRFFGRKDDPGTLRDAYSFEPQANTTWATNTMLLRLWTDPENRQPDGTLIVEPLHQVHDAAMFQGPAELREWIKVKVQGWFNNPLVIGGVEVVIPYEMGVGANWKKMEKVEIL